MKAPASSAPFCCARRQRNPSFGVRAFGVRAPRIVKVDTIVVVPEPHGVLVSASPPFTDRKRRY